MNDFFHPALQQGLTNRYPLIYVKCREEQRLLKQLQSVSDHFFDSHIPVKVWSCNEGIEKDPSLSDPLKVIRSITASKPKGITLLKDLPALLDSDPTLVRALRDLYDAVLGSECCVVLSHPGYQLPDALQGQVWFVDLGMPTSTEIDTHLNELLIRFERNAEISNEWISQVASAMKGLGLGEVTHLFYGWHAENRFDLASVIKDIYANKTASLQKEGCLQFMPKNIQVDEVGGLENLKEWVLSRKSLFSRESIKEGVPMPAGILFMGVSGCGKSLAAKVIAGAWNLPLVRLDMNLVMSGAYGSPEFAFDHALRIAENISPLVLWIDEMENSFGYDGNSSGGNNSIFSTFLTWLQEKPPEVFVVATANRIERLPAEVIRKGRFDQLFFLDLPSDEERRAIFRIHISAYGADPDSFNMNLLSILTKEWSGAEIEQAVKAARIHAYQEGRLFDEKDITYTSARMVPLSRTMEEQIKHLRQWSQTRATPASRKAG
jgi:AAA+ superfamily predicted ATPase